MKNPKVLSDNIISKLGYKLEDIKKIRNTHTNTLKEFRSKPPEMVIAESRMTNTIRFTDGYTLKIKKGKRYLLDLLLFIDGYHAKLFKPTNRFIKYFKFWKGENLNNKKILCWVYGGGIGDLFFVQPVLRYIKKKYPKSIIALVYPARHSIFTKHWDFIDELYSSPVSDIPFMSSDYHLHFDGIINKCVESEKINVYKILAKWVNLDIPNKELKPLQKIDMNRVEKCKKILHGWNLNVPFLILQLRASTIHRTPRPEFWLNLLNGLVNKGISVVFVDQPKESFTIDALIKKCNRPDLVYNFSPYSKDMGDAMAMIFLSKLVVSIDTGLIHIASAIGKPTYGIYGPFPGKIRLETYDKCNWIDAPCDCAPCMSHSYSSCKHAIRGYPICYDKININKLVNNILEECKIKPL